jgi:hypothetical protein
MNPITLIVVVLLSAIIIASLYNVKQLAALVKFLRMDRNEQEQTIEKVRDDNRYWSQRNDKVSMELIFAGVFLSLSALCAYVGLWYTCGYTFFHGTMMLSQGMRNQIRLFIMHYKNPNVVDVGNVYEFRAA